LRVLFVEPPKDFWFIMGQYIPPPFGILALAGYLEREIPSVEIAVIDSQSEGLDWAALEARIKRYKPDLVAPSGMSTANAYLSLRTAQITKKIDKKTITVLGGQHFTALATETLQRYPEVDCIILGEGEVTLTELVKCLIKKEDTTKIEGLASRKSGATEARERRELICNLDTLPYPAYHYVADHMKNYYFSLMAEKESRFAIIEGSRGCSHNCSYCSQSPFWRHKQRTKSTKRIVDEIEKLHNEYGSSFFWFTDDYFTLDKHAYKISEDIIERELEISWFCQARCDDIIKHQDTLPLLKKSGCVWMLVGFDTPNPDTLRSYKREGLTRDTAKEAVNALRHNQILSQGTFIIGHRTDTREKIASLREYADWLDPDIATFMALTPYPGTEIYEAAKQNGWIIDENWAHYDMIHAIMPTESLTREEVQEELYRCYNEFFGNWDRRFRGIRSTNPYVRRTYQYLAKQAILKGFRSLF
jgi:anaerobic magnesium-protoporphyrin IX monomethyl ester cyclase